MMGGLAHDPFFASPDSTADLVCDGTIWKTVGMIAVPSVSDLGQKCIVVHHDPRQARLAVTLNLNVSPF